MPFFTFWTNGSLYVALFISVQVYCAAHAETRVCLHSTRRIPLQLSCPKRHVIMSPNVMVGKMAGSLQPNGDCQYNSQRDCFGTTPEVVAQVNECHFQKACSITLNRYMPITSSANRSCLALRPDYAILYSHECVRRKSLHFLCGGRSGEEVIKRKEGALVSHDAYPWHYQGYRNCIANLTAPKRHHRLSLWSEDLDIDPENRDSITLYNVLSDCSTELIGEPIKSSAMGLNITVPSSEVVIKFSIGEFTKSGRGFVIKFKWLRGGAKGRMKTASCPQSKGKKNKKGKKKNKKKKHNRNGSSIATTTPSGAQKTKRPRGRNSRRNGRKGKKTRNMTP